MKYTELKQLRDNKTSKMYEDLKVFFAFGDNQFNEGLKETGETKENILSIGYGGYMPKANKEEYIKQNKDIDIWFIEEVKKLDPESVIRYELNNYECFYSGSISDAYPILKEYGYSKDQVISVLNKYSQEDF